MDQKIKFAAAALTILLPAALLSQDQTSTGFFYPRSSNTGPYAWFLAQGCSSATDYFGGEFHLGKDSWAFFGGCPIRS